MIYFRYYEFTDDSNTVVIERQNLRNLKIDNKYRTYKTLNGKGKVRKNPSVSDTNVIIRDCDIDGFRSSIVGPKSIVFENCTLKVGQFNFYSTQTVTFVNCNMVARSLCFYNCKNIIIENSKIRSHSKPSVFPVFLYVKGSSMSVTNSEIEWVNSNTSVIVTKSSIQVENSSIRVGKRTKNPYTIILEFSSIDISDDTETNVKKNIIVNYSSTESEVKIPTNFKFKQEVLV